MVRCPKGTRKNKITGQCEVSLVPMKPSRMGEAHIETPITTLPVDVLLQNKQISVKSTDSKKTQKRCPRGQRKNKHGVCVSSKPIITFEKIPDDPPIQLSPKKSTETIEEQCKSFNQIQNKFVFKPYNGSINLIKIHNKKDDSHCGDITFPSKTEIYIDYLSKCGIESGTEIIMTIERFGKMFHYKKIGLEDDSTIGRVEKMPNGGHCILLLSILSILCTGETWYNKLGYKSKYYKKETFHNKQIIELQASQFFTTYLPIALKNKKILPGNQTDYDKVMGYLHLCTFKTPIFLNVFLFYLLNIIKN